MTRAPSYERIDAEGTRSPRSFEPTRNPALIPPGERRMTFAFTKSHASEVHPADIKKMNAVLEAERKHAAVVVKLEREYLHWHRATQLFGFLSVVLPVIQFFATFGSAAGLHAWTVLLSATFLAPLATTALGLLATVGAAMAIVAGGLAYARYIFAGLRTQAALRLALTKNSR